MRTRNRHSFNRSFHWLHKIRHDLSAIGLRLRLVFVERDVKRARLCMYVCMYINIYMYIYTLWVRGRLINTQLVPAHIFSYDPFQYINGIPELLHYTKCAVCPENYELRVILKD